MSPKQALAVLVAGFQVQDLAPETERLYTAMLAQMPPRTLGRAVDAALERCRVFRVLPPLAEIVEIAAEIDGSAGGHPGPEEAWALVAGLTEAGTVVWTDPIAQAWAVASGVLPDRVGARMAFLERYRRVVAEARSAGVPARWWVSLGLDPSGRPGPIHEAVACGRLSIPEARVALPPHEWPAQCRPSLAVLSSALAEDRDEPMDEEKRPGGGIPDASS